MPNHPHTGYKRAHRHTLPPPPTRGIAQKKTPHLKFFACSEESAHAFAFGSLGLVAVLSICSFCGGGASFSGKGCAGFSDGSALPVANGLRAAAAVAAGRSAAGAGPLPQAAVQPPVRAVGGGPPPPSARAARSTLLDLLPYGQLSPTSCLLFVLWHFGQHTTGFPSLPAGGGGVVDWLLGWNGVGFSNYLELLESSYRCHK